MSKPEIPFEKLFKRVPPKDFVTLFSLELPQTIAFILSFSPIRGYIKKVLHIFDDMYPGNDANTLEEKTSFIIRDYLKCREESFDRIFVSELEQEVNRMIADYEDLLNFRKLRKRLFRVYQPAVHARGPGCIFTANGKNTTSLHDVVTMIY